MSSDYARFEREYLGGRPGYANEGMPPIELLERLDARERVEAEAQLIAQLRSRNQDRSWPAEGVAHMAIRAKLPWRSGESRETMRCWTYCTS